MQDLKQLLRQIKEEVETPVYNAMKVGIMNITNPRVASQYSRGFLVDKQIVVAMDSQTEIGWDNFMCGRISTLWKKTVKSPSQEWDPDRWATKVTRAGFQVITSLWKQRNTLVHGNDGEMSKLELQRTQ